MTAKELISQLEMYEENTTVYCYDPETYIRHAIREVQLTEDTEKNRLKYLTYTLPDKVSGGVDIVLY